MSDRTSRRAYQQKISGRVRANLREFKRDKSLKENVEGSVFGVLVGTLMGRLVSGEWFSAGSVSIGLVGAVGGWLLVYLRALISFRLSAPHELDEERKANLESEKSASRKTLGEAARKHSEELAQINERSHNTATRELEAEELAERKRQNALSARQIELLEAQHQPLFRFVSERRTIGSETFDVLEIWNDGASIETYEIRQASYILVSRPKRADNKIADRETRYLPTFYFNRRDYQGDAKVGLLVTLYAWNDPIGPQAGRNLTKEYERIAAEVQPYGLEMTISKRVFLKISYVDRTATQRMVTYEIYPPYTGYRPAVAQRREGLELPMLIWRDLHQITANSLLEDWENRALMLTGLGPGADNH